MDASTKLFPLSKAQGTEETVPKTILNPSPILRDSNLESSPHQAPRPMYLEILRKATKGPQIA